VKDDLKIYKLLGAEVFQKIVFKLESFKFLIIDKLFPNAKVRYEKSCDKKVENKCKKLTSEEDKRNVKSYYKIQKLKYRKELVHKKNRNYHLNLNDPDETVGYLKINKKIHQRGIINNAILIIISVLAMWVASGPLAICFLSLLIFNVGGVVINFQCINLQNYNLKRFELNEKKIRKFSKRKQDKSIEQYGEAATLISTQIEKSEHIPEPNEIVREANNLEQLRQMKELLLSYIEPSDIIKKEVL
jgi:hypothetical protein